jgi:cobalamin synthase
MALNTEGRKVASVLGFPLVGLLAGMWLAAVMTTHVFGGLIHVLIVFAIVVASLRAMRGHNVFESRE